MAFQFSSTAFCFPRNPRKSIYGEKYTKDHYLSFVFFATRSPTHAPSFVIPATIPYRNELVVKQNWKHLNATNDIDDDNTSKQNNNVSDNNEGGTQNMSEEKERGKGFEDSSSSDDDEDDNQNDDDRDDAKKEKVKVSIWEV